MAFTPEQPAAAALVGRTTPDTSDTGGSNDVSSVLAVCNNPCPSSLLHMGVREFVLFSFWKTGSPMGLFGSCLLVVLVCILHEAIDLFRTFLAKQHAVTCPDDDDSASSVVSLDSSLWTKLKNALNSYRLTQSALYALQNIAGYIIILIIVSFNFWLILSVVIGKSIGYFLFTGSPTVQKTAMALDNSPPPMRRTQLRTPFSTASYYPHSEGGCS